MTPRERADRLKAWALEAGFDRAGVAVLERAADGDAFVRWLAEGRQAGMAWLERRVEERLDPRVLLPGARSVLCVALRYRVPADEQVGGDLWPGVARYARGDDYHHLMGRRLRALCARIEQALPGTVTRCYVDTGPVLERAWAARAGLGAVGKNTNLLHPEDGSYFLLGEVLLGLDLEGDPPLQDLCGACRLCLDACPTGALPAPYLLDSAACISYWTIEHRGGVPAEVRPTLGHWVFGCDVCQEVCPWNREPEPARDPALGLPEHRRRLSLADLVALDRGSYEAAFRRSPMKRAKLEGLRRNAALAMGNGGRERYLPALAEALGDPEDAVLRGHAAWALGRIGGDRAAAALRGRLDREPAPEVRDEIEAALAALERRAPG